MHTQKVINTKINPNIDTHKNNVHPLTKISTSSLGTIKPNYKQIIVKK
jgi:hypothetical protein